MTFFLNNSIDILRRTPAVLSTQLKGLSPEWTQNNYGEDSWSVHEVIGHLVWGEKTDWVPRTKHILEHGDSVPFEPFEMKGHLDLCLEKSTDELLDLFSEERTNSLRELADLDLSLDDFSKTGTHPALGSVTVSQQLSTWTAHDMSHIAQINRAMAFQYKEAVGPWKAYMSIMG